MKRITILLLITLFTSHLCTSAQETTSATVQEINDSTDIIQSTIDACIAMRDAAAAGDSAALMQSAMELRQNEVANFNSLRCKDDTIGSLIGHLVFDEAFADSLATGHDAYRSADDLNRTAAHRGRTADGSVLTRSCFVKAGKSSRYSFSSKGHQELAVVAEAGGLVSMKVHCTNSAGLDVWHNDTRDFRAGRPQRKIAFDLPNNRRNTVEIEVFNRSTRDISFVIISN